MEPCEAWKSTKNKTLIIASLPIPFLMLLFSFCYKLIIGLPVGAFSVVNLTNTLENRAASGYEAPKALQKFSWETGFQVSGDIILLALLVVYCLQFIF